MFSIFPDGLPGIGLLLLRLGLGSLLTLWAIAYFRERQDPESATVIFLLLMLVVGVLLMAGLRTRLAAIAAILAFIGAIILSSRGPSPDLLSAHTIEAFAAVIATAVACLGPGAFSVDSHLFGRREIIIPKSPHKD